MKVFVYQNNYYITVKLFADHAPKAVENFIGLAEGTKNYSKTGGEPKAEGKPFYDGLTLHRFITDFMINGGDPQGRPARYFCWD